MKLIMQTISTGTRCKLCEKIDTKMRRRAAEAERINRWQQDELKFCGSINKSLDMIRRLDHEVYELGIERARRLSNSWTPELDPAVKNTTTAGGREGGAVESQEPRFELIKSSDRVCGLPITFEGSSGPASVMAIPDTGAAVNVMSLDLASHLGLRVDWDTEDKTELKLLDGTTATSTATVKAFCWFARTFHTEAPRMRCVFFVLLSLASDLIMSAAFLEEIETFTKFRNRLIELALKSSNLLKIRSIGRMRQRVQCCVDGGNVLAIADSGSDVDILSLSYASKRSLRWQTTTDIVELADGSTRKACGKVVAQLSLGMDAKLLSVETPDCSMELDGTIAIDSKEPATESQLAGGLVCHVLQTTFYILDGIVVDALVGGRSSESLRLYTEHAEALTSRADEDLQDDTLYRIGLVGKIRTRFSGSSPGIVHPEPDHQGEALGMHRTSLLSEPTLTTNRPQPTRATQ